MHHGTHVNEFWQMDSEYNITSQFGNSTHIEGLRGWVCTTGRERDRERERERERASEQGEEIEIGRERQKDI